MVCYAIPLVATLLLLTGRKLSGSHAAHGFWLNIMMLGGAAFGLIDHMFTGELFIVTSAWMTDLALGGMITAGITACWGFVVLKPRIYHSMNQIACRLGVVKKDVRV